MELLAVAEVLQEESVEQAHAEVARVAENTMDQQVQTLNQIQVQAVEQDKVTLAVQESVRLLIT